MNVSAGSPVFGLYGAGGFAREVMPVLRASAGDWAGFDPARVFFVETRPSARSVNGCSVVSEDEFFELPCASRHFNVAIGTSKVRAEIAERCIARGAQPINLLAPNSVMHDENTIGPGLVLCPFAMVTSNARLGRFVHLNIYSYVAHDCVIGDFVTLAPGAKCNGNVHVGNHAYIGTGAIIKQGDPSKPITIGEGAVVGMGAVVTKDVAPWSTVVGNPARPIIRS